MFSPNRNSLFPRNGGTDQPVSKEAKRRMTVTVVLTAVAFVVWFGGIALAEHLQNLTIQYVIMSVYCLSFAVILIAYLLYNRAFVNKDVTEDMLPLDWSPEKRKAFVEDTRRRAEKSRWMLMLIIPFVVTFMAEALYLFVWDGYLAKLFGG